LSQKQPVLLAVLIESRRHRWHVAVIDRAGDAAPLLCSQPGDLSGYIGQPLDEQVSCLRHRLSGVLQRGCDRLWSRGQKASQIVFVVDGPFPQAEPVLSQRVADHFVDWMVSPPVAYFHVPDLTSAGVTDLTRLAGQVPAEDLAAVVVALPQIVAARADESQWEVISIKPSS
jgi:hypothetical protein